MSVQIDQKSLAFRAVKVADIPEEGPIAVPVPINFATSTDFDLDISQQVNQGRISLVQSMFVDNSANNNPINIGVGQSPSSAALQTIVVPSQSQGYFQIFSPNPARFHFNSQATGSILVILSNSPIASATWQAK